MKCLISRTVNSRLFRSRLTMHRSTTLLKCSFGACIPTCNLSFNTSASSSPGSQSWNILTFLKVSRCTLIAISALSLSGRAESTRSSSRAPLSAHVYANHLITERKHVLKDPFSPPFRLMCKTKPLILVVTQDSDQIAHKLIFSYSVLRKKN